LNIKYQINEERKMEQKILVPLVMSKIEPKAKFNLIFPNENDKFPISLVGIMAAKIVEETNKPTIVLYKKEKDGRTPEYFNFVPLIEELKKRKLILGGGGHKALLKI